MLDFPHVPFLVHHRDQPALFVGQFDAHMRERLVGADRDRLCRDRLPDRAEGSAEHGHGRCPFRDPVRHLQVRPWPWPFRLPPRTDGIGS